MRYHLSRLLAGTAFAILAFPAFADDTQDPIGRFEITRFQIDGNTLLPQRVVDSIVQPFAGKARNFGDVQKALEALEAAYHKRGFNVVQVALPEQELNQGVVRLQVVEIRIGKVKVEGNKVFDERNIRRSLPGLVEGKTPNIGNISSSLRLANENPSKKVALQLQGSENDDEIDATLKVTDDKPWRVAASVDNTGNKTTGDTYLTLQYQHANIADLDHVLSLQYTTTLEQPKRIGVYGAGYHLPLYALGDSVDLFASYSDVDSGSVLAGIFNLQVSGRGTVFGGRYNQNLQRVGNFESKLIYGLDYKAYENNVSLQGVQLGNDVTVHPLSVAYTGNWGVAGGDVNFNIAAIRNIPGGDRGSSADFARVRAGAPANYKMLRYNAGWTRLLPNDWQMRFSLAGQATSDPLIPGEQFGAGGASTVRGFRERDVSNDSGHLVNAELYSPNFCSTIGSYAALCRALVFYDTARVSRNNSLPGEVSRASIGSVGLGMRINIDKYVALQTDYGHVVDGGQTQGKGDKRLHFRLAVSY